MFDHGEAVVRSYFEKLPDGRYVGRGVMDDDGISDEPVPFEVMLEVEGSTVALDFSDAPDARPGPVNCPVPSTVSASRVAISMLAGGGESPNEGHFRPIEVVARPGSMFHPAAAVAVLPLRLAGDAGDRGDLQGGREGDAGGGPAPAAAATSAPLVWWGVRERRRAVGRRLAAPGRPGCVDPRRRRERLMHHAEAATRFSPTEVWEAKNPWLLERSSSRPDSGGAGRHRGGLGVDMVFQALEDAT